MMRGITGFSLVELLVAIAITTTVTALACALAIEAQAAWRADNARVDLHQRGRVAADTLSRTLLTAGAGPGTGAARGPLLRVLAPVLPRRIGVRRPDTFGTFRSDAFSVLYALADAEHGALSVGASAGAATLDLDPTACDLESCGFEPDETVLLLDSTGNYDVFSVTEVQAASVGVLHHGGGSSVTYPPGSPVVRVESRTYYFDAAAGTLRVYDGHASDLPLLDDVVGMRVEYFGTVFPPTWPRPPAGVANCLYDSDGSYRASLMPAVGSSSLGAEAFTDGPWCGSGINQFDADLLRVRRILVTVRIQAADSAVRGTNPSQFRNPGTAQRTALTVPDATVVVDITPRNLRESW